MDSSVTFAIRASLVAVGLALLFACFGPGVRKDVPYVPTPEPIVKRMLEMAATGPGDTVYDLGSGDGRIVIAAARDYGVRKGVGVDIDPARVRESRRNAEKAGVSNRVSFHEGNVFSFDFNAATVLTMYLLPEINRKLRPRILGELTPGTRVVSHQFDMGDWRPDAAYKGRRNDIYLWVVPARAGGRWTGADPARGYRLELVQRYQDIAGTFVLDGREIPLEHGRLDGGTFVARVPGPDGRDRRFEATIRGDRMDATLSGARLAFQREKEAAAE